jgi:AcrR family transcriptional regulator
MPPTQDAALTARIVKTARALAGTDWSMADLARRAKVSRAALYRRFSSREEVMSALATEAGPTEVDAGAALRDRVLDAFEAVAKRKGLAGTTLEDVAREAGVGVATIYRRFGTREGLLTAYADERTPRAVLAAFERSDDGDLESMLRAIVHAAMEHLKGHWHLVMMAVSPDPETQRVVAHLRKLEEEGRAQLTRLLARHVKARRIKGDPSLLSLLLMGMVVGVVMGGRRTTPEAIVKLFLDGCRGDR